MCVFHQATKRVSNKNQKYHEEIIQFQENLASVCIHLHDYGFCGAGAEQCELP